MKLQIRLLCEENNEEKIIARGEVLISDMPKKGLKRSHPLLVKALELLAAQIEEDLK